MRIIVFLLNHALGQSPAPPLSDTRLSIHTLVREDIFAGWRSDNWSGMLVERRTSTSY